MYFDSKKIQLIEEVLRLNDDSVLKELEAIIKRSKVKTKQKKSTKQSFLRELRASLKEVGLAKKGKIKLQSAKNFINGL